MSVKLKNQKSVLTDEEIEQYCYSVEKLLVDINNRSNTKKRKKENKTKGDVISLQEDKQLLSMN
jgi:hypothetical protein